MEFMDDISPGISREETFTVNEEHTAYHIGSGDERVLGTPWMISYMERVSNRLVLKYLPAVYMSVGVYVDVKHLAPTPIGMNVQIRVEILEVSNNRILMNLEAWDQVEKIGEGSHERVVVEKERFMQRVLKKSSQLL
jgi:fluoroacetyl-CoA thioesterase